MLTKEQIGLDRITPSMINTYDDCPLLFYYQYWLGLQLPQDKRHLQFGTAFHEALGEIYRQYDTNFGGGWEFANVDIAKIIFLKNWKLSHISDEEFARVLKLKSNSFATKEELYESMKQDGLDMIDNYWNHKELLLVTHGIDVVHTEIAYKLPLVNPANTEEKLPIPLSLRIDGITRNGDVIEFKTSASEYDPIETRNSAQALAYPYARWRETGKIPKVIYVVNIKGRKSQTAPQVIELTFNESDMQAFYHRVEAVLQRIANREFDRGKASGFTKYELEKYEKALSII